MESWHFWPKLFCRHQYVEATFSEPGWKGEVCTKCDHLNITRRPLIVVEITAQAVVKVVGGSTG